MHSGGKFVSYWRLGRRPAFGGLLDMSANQAVREAGRSGCEGEKAVLWNQCVASCRDYLLKPRGSILFSVVNPLVACPTVWGGDRPESTHEFVFEGLNQFEEAMLREDAEAALEVAERLQHSMADPAERATLRFVLAGRVLLVHRQAGLAYDVLGTGCARKDRGEAVLLDCFLFGVRFRASGTNELAHLEKLLRVSPRFGHSAIDEFVKESLRFDNFPSEFHEILLSLSEGLPGRGRQILRGSALAVALRQGNRDAADRLTDPEALPTNILSRLLPLSDYLESRGIPSSWRSRNAEVREMAALYRHFVEERNRMLDEFSDPRCRIAIVGNSGCETGRGRGREIDSHDRIVRFNYFSADSKFHADYGQRTDLHARTGKSDGDLFCRSVRIGRGLICEPNFLFVPHDWSRMIELVSAGVRLACFPEGFHADLQRELHTAPSTGLAVIALVKSQRRDFSSVNCFGFAFTDQIDGSASSTHYFDNSPPAMTHNWTGERRVFEKLISAPVDSCAALCSE